MTDIFAKRGRRTPGTPISPPASAPQDSSETTESMGITGLATTTGQTIKVELWSPGPPVSGLLSRSSSISLSRRESTASAKRRRRQSIRRVGHVEIGEILGSGAMAKVYLGVIQETREVIALKQLTFTRKKDYEAMWSEMMMLKDLIHPNIIRYRGLQHNESTNEVNILLEFVPSSLQQLILDRGHVPEIEAAHIMKQVLSGLAYLHSQKVIHRDLKPANILITKQGLVKITDFGASTHVNEVATMRRTCIGTPYYTAPEVISIEPYSYSSDVWSVACCAIELVTGKRPYHGLNEMAAMFRMVEEEHPEIPEDVSEVFRAFLLACWQKNPKMRPSAEKLLEHPFILLDNEYERQIAAQTVSVENPLRSGTTPLSKLSRSSRKQDTSMDVSTDSGQPSITSPVSSTLSDVQSPPPAPSSPDVVVATVPETPTVVLDTSSNHESEQPTAMVVVSPGSDTIISLQDHRANSEEQAQSQASHEFVAEFTRQSSRRPRKQTSFLLPQSDSAPAVMSSPPSAPSKTPEVATSTDSVPEVSTPNGATDTLSTEIAADASPAVNQDFVAVFVNSGSMRRKKAAFMSSPSKDDHKTPPPSETASASEQEHIATDQERSTTAEVDMGSPEPSDVPSAVQQQQQPQTSPEPGSDVEIPSSQPERPPSVTAEIVADSAVSVSEEQQFQDLQALISAAAATANVTAVSDQPETPAPAAPTAEQPFVAVFSSDPFKSRKPGPPFAAKKPVIPNPPEDEPPAPETTTPAQEEESTPKSIPNLSRQASRARHARVTFSSTANVIATNPDPVQLEGLLLANALDERQKQELISTPPLAAIADLSPAASSPSPVPAPLPPALSVPATRPHRLSVPSMSPKQPLLPKGRRLSADVAPVKQFDLGPKPLSLKETLKHLNQLALSQRLAAGNTTTSTNTAAAPQTPQTPQTPQAPQTPQTPPFFASLRVSSPKPRPKKAAVTKDDYTPSPAVAVFEKYYDETQQRRVLSQALQPSPPPSLSPAPAVAPAARPSSASVPRRNISAPRERPKTATPASTTAARARATPKATRPISASRQRSPANPHHFSAVYRPVTITRAPTRVAKSTVMAYPPAVQDVALHPVPPRVLARMTAQAWSADAERKRMAAWKR